MGHLNTAERKGLPKSDFGVPSNAPGPGSYPIENEDHARDALSRVAQHGTAAEIAEVHRRVREKYPHMVMAKPAGE